MELSFQEKIEFIIPKNKKGGLFAPLYQNRKRLYVMTFS
jgi:hypothetical protein